MKYNVLKSLGSGSASDAFLLEHGKVLIVGKRADCFENYQALMKKSNLLEGKITAICYPKIYELISPCKEFPFGAMIEDYVAGEELRKRQNQLTEKDKKEIGKRLALFLNELHAIKFDGDKDAEIKINLGKFDRSVNMLKDYLPKETLEKLAVIKQHYLKFMQSKDFCVTHGDLNAGNIMIDENNNLSGLIDFGNMEYYVPEVEFPHMFFFDKTIFNSMSNHYNKKIDEKELVLLELVISVRHFKNVVNFDEKRKKCLENINEYMSNYFGNMSLQNGHEATTSKS